MSTTGIRRSIVVVAMATSLTAAGCGGGNESPTTDGSQTAGSNNAGEDIPIALVYPTSGVWTTQGTNSVRGAEMAIADINEAGGVLDGRMLVPVVADAGNDPQTASSAARRLLQQNDVAALLGAYLSSYSLTVSTVAEQAKIPNITQSFSDELITRDYKYIFKTTPTAAEFSGAVFDYLSEMYAAEGKDLPSVAIMASDDASGQQQYSAAVEAAPKAGFDVTLEVSFPANITDTNSLVNRLADADPDLLLLNGPDLAEIQIVQAMRARGIDIPIVGLGGAGVTTQAFVTELGEGVNGVMATVPFNADASERGLDIAARYNEKHGGTFMPAESGTAYVGASLVAEAIEHAGSADPEDVAAALRELEVSAELADLYPGNAIKFGDNGLNEASIPLMVQYQQGVPVTIWPKEEATAEPQL